MELEPNIPSVKNTIKLPITVLIEDNLPAKRLKVKIVKPKPKIYFASEVELVIE